VARYQYLGVALIAPNAKNHAKRNALANLFGRVVARDVMNLHRGFVADEAHQSVLALDSSSEPAMSKIRLANEP
jgi:hypothetical protein